ncbi:MAG: flagellar hook-basal body complex protein FliE [Candidatus Tokpelaia sp. JSC189]|nr:MAG: flagellar hook-basal body complex protein FliE [Candidatus Tokpelaia sp. JSC189]
MMQSLLTLATHTSPGGVYGQAVGIAGSANTWASSRGQLVGQESFDQILSGIAGVAISRLRAADMISMRKMSGEDVAIRDVVNSIMDAEQALNTSIAIRDKIVQSYLEISRMQI